MFDGKPETTPAAETQIERDLRRARAMRAKTFAWLFAGRGPAAETGAPTPDVAHQVVNSLTAIRSTAEMLRDHPEIDVGERRHFLAMLLKEEARLEGLLPQALRALGGGGGRANGGPAPA